MTITQIAETAGCSRDTVKRLVKTMFPNLKSRGKGIALDLNEDKCLQLMDKLPKKNYVDLPSANAPSNIMQNTHVDYEAIGKMIAVAVSSAMQPILAEIKNNNQDKPKQLSLPPAPDIKPRALLRQLVNDYASSINITHREAWNELYKQFYYRCNESIKTKANNLKMIPLDYLEQENKLLTACSIMKDLLK